MAETVVTRHRISGAIDRNTPIHLLEHPVFGELLEVVDADAKPYLPEMHRSGKRAEDDKPVETAEVVKVDDTKKKNGKD